MSEALQASAAGAYAHQQGVLEEPIGQDRHGGEVGQEAAGEQQHPLAAKPGGKGLLQLLVNEPGAGDQAGGASTEAAAVSSAEAAASTAGWRLGPR